MQVISLKFRFISYQGFLSIMFMSFGACKSNNTTPDGFPDGVNSNDFPLFKRGCEMKSISFATHVCEMLFFLELKSRPDVLCSEVYVKLEECVRAKRDECFARLTSQRSHDYATKFRYLLQTQYCNDGSLSVKKSRPINYCRAVDYHDQVEQCYKAYHRTFRRNASDDSLCVKYEKAKACAAKAEQAYCQNGNEILEKLRQLSNTDRCWNPFCGPSVVEFRGKILERGFKFSFLSKEIQRHLSILTRKYQVEGFDRKLMGHGVPLKSCSFNSAIVISNAIINFLNQSSTDDADYNLPKYSNMKEEKESAASTKTKRTSPADNGNNAKVCRPILIVLVGLLTTVIGSLGTSD